MASYARTMLVAFLLACACLSALVSAASVPTRRRSSSSTMLCAATSHKRRSRKTVHLHDIARNDSRNEYFAGGQDEEGRGSATVLIYPDEPDADANETDAAAEPEEQPKASRMSGSGRKL